MLPRPMSRSEPSAQDFYSLSPPDLTSVLEQHLATSFPPDLALDLVLNELVVRAADATRASGGALSLFRGDTMVCRAATGLGAPDLGIPVNMHAGLSGACITTRTPQLCSDAECDSRIDPTVSRRLGIRSILMVPVLDDEKWNDEASIEEPPDVVGILEVLSPVPHAFSDGTQGLLEDFAREVSNVIRAAEEHLRILPAAESDHAEPELLKSFDSVPPAVPEPAPVLPVHQPYEAWTIFLGALVFLAAVGISFLVGSRVGWLRPAPQAIVVAKPSAPAAAASLDLQTDSGAPPATNSDSPGMAADRADASRKKANTKASAPPVKKSSADDAPVTASNELVFYEKGKVVYRMKPPANPSESASSTVANENSPHPAAADDAAPVSSSVVPASSSRRISSPDVTWIAPNAAEGRLLTRVEPQYPTDALAQHRSGSVVLEVNVAEDGTVSSVRPLIGDPVLAAAAAEAVRSWRYQPYRQHERAFKFQTDVTVTFSAPN